MLALELKIGPSLLEIENPLDLVLGSREQPLDMRIQSLPLFVKIYITKYTLKHYKIIKLKFYKFVLGLIQNL